MKKLPSKMNRKGRLYTFILTHVICRVACFLWLKNSVKGPGNIPVEGSYIVASNHQSYLDFMLLIFIFRKDFPTFFIHKEHYYSIFNFFLKDLEQVPAVNGSIKKAEIVLMEGLPLFIFPEGRRTKGEIGRFHCGAAVLAEKFPKIPIVPVGIKGAIDIWPHETGLPKFFAGRGISVRIDKSLKFTDFGSREHFLAVLREKIAQLSV